MAWLDDYWILLDDFSWKRRFTLASWDTHCRNAVAPELRWTKKITRVSAKNDAALLGCFTRAQIHCLLIICSFIHGHFMGTPCIPHRQTQPFHSFELWTVAKSTSTRCNIRASKRWWSWWCAEKGRHPCCGDFVCGGVSRGHETCPSDRGNEDATMEWGILLGQVGLRACYTLAVPIKKGDGHGL